MSQCIPSTAIDDKKVQSYFLCFTFLTQGPAMRPTRPELEASCVSLPSAGIMGVWHHARLLTFALEESVSCK
jgi:hypothetical protein